MPELLCYWLNTVSQVEHRTQDALSPMSKPNSNIPDPYRMELSHKGRKRTWWGKGEQIVSSLKVDTKKTRRAKFCPFVSACCVFPFFRIGKKMQYTILPHIFSKL